MRTEKGLLLKDWGLFKKSGKRDYLCDDRRSSLNGWSP